MINFSGINPADYDRLYAFMHRISNAKIHAAGENAEWEDWKNYESCDGPACAGNVVETTAAPTTAAPTTVAEEVVEVVEATVANVTVVSDECADAQKKLEAEENALAKIPLKAACELACSEDSDATCGFLVNGVSMILFAVLAMLKQ